MNKWLSFDEVCMELRLGEKAIRSMLRNGQLVGYQVPTSHADFRRRGKMGAWRILDPGAKFARYLEESKQRVEHVPLLSGREAAAVLGVKPGTIRQLKKRHRLQGTASTQGTLYSVQELRRLLWKRDCKARKNGRALCSPTLITWARGIVAKDAGIQAEALDELLRQAVFLSEPAKSHYVVKIWEHFDAVNYLLRSATLGEDPDFAATKAKSSSIVPRLEKNAATALIHQLKRNHTFRVGVV